MRRITITHTTQAAGFLSKQSVDIETPPFDDTSLIDLLRHKNMRELSNMLVKHGDILTISTEPED